MNLFEIGNTGTRAPKSQFTVYFGKGSLMCDFNTSETWELAATLRVGVWHTIEAIVGYGDSAYSAEVRLGADEPRRFSSKRNKDPETVRALWIHYPNVPVDYTMDVDDVRMLTADERPDLTSS